MDYYEKALELPVACNNQIVSYLFINFTLYIRIYKSYFIVYIKFTV